MKRIIKNIMIIYACILMVSCGENSINKTLDCVENIIVSYPDSALMLLYSIKNSFEFNNEQRARHAVLSLYAKDLTYEDISKDTVIIYVIDYLKTAGNPKYLAFAEYYLGRMYQAQGRNEQALQFYLDAKANAEHSDDDDIKGLIYSYIGQQYYMQRKYENAIGNFKLALEHFNKSQENYKRKIAVLNNIGNCFLLEGIKDSAMVHYNESIRLAETAQDSANVMHNLGMAYLSFNDADKAKQRLFHALNLSPDSASRSSIFLNLSKVYKKEKMMDSAIYFAKLSLQSVKNNDEYILANIYNTLSNMEKEKKNYEKAYEYYKQYNDYIIRINNERHNNHNNVQVIETRHDLDVLQRKNNNLTTKVIIGVLVLVIVGGIFLKYLHLEKKKVVRQRTKVVELNKEIAEQRRKIVELEQKLSDYDTDINNKKAELIKKEETFFKIMRKNIKKIALFDNYIDLVNNKINNEILSTAKLLNLQNEKTVLHDDINILYNDILNKTRIKYPVTEQKFKIICLICVDLDNYDIASILGIDKHIVEREKSEIRKILKIKAREDIKSFVLEDMKTIL